MNKDTTESFLIKAKRIHGNKYDYSKTEYENSLKEVIITCSIHGDFLIKPCKHLGRGQGCRKCCVHKNRSKEDEIFKKV